MTPWLRCITVLLLQRSDKTDQKHGSLSTRQQLMNSQAAVENARKRAQYQRQARSGRSASLASSQTIISCPAVNSPLLYQMPKTSRSRQACTFRRSPTIAPLIYRRCDTSTSFSCLWAMCPVRRCSSSTSASPTSKMRGGRSRPMPQNPRTKPSPPKAGRNRTTQFREGCKT